MSQKLLQGLVSRQFTAHISDFNLIRIKSSKVLKANNFESHKSLKLITSIRGPLSNSVGCESFLESNSSDILALCETNFEDSIDSSNFCERDYLPLIRKNSATHMHSLAIYVKEKLPLARELHLEIRVRINCSQFATSESSYKSCESAILIFLS